MSASTAQHHASECVLAHIRSAWRWAALALASLSLSLITASLPVDIGYHLTSDANSSYTPYVIADIGESKAYANAEPVYGAVDLLHHYADASGLQYGEFVAAVAAIVTSSTGMVTGAADGIMLDSGLEKNLSDLVDAADYPDWSNLDASTQELWGSKQNYDAAKFNSLLDAFGFEELSDQYYGSFDGSGGGGDFDPDSTQMEILHGIGRVGQRWAMGLGNTYQSISALITNKQALNGYFGVIPGYGFNGAGYANWPSSLPTYIELANSNNATIYTAKPTEAITYIGVWQTDSPVWMLVGRDPGHDDVNVAPYTDYNVWMFSESPFTYGASRSGYGSSTVPTVTQNRTSVHRTDQGSSYYFGSVELNMSKRVIQSNVPVMDLGRGADVYTAFGLIMSNGGPTSTGGVNPDLPGYPEESPNPDEMIYYPSEGVTTNNTWNNYTTPTPIIRPDNPFNPGDTSGTDKWKDETEANTKQLGAVHFEKLFPFCLLYDITLLFEKMQSLGVLPEQNGVINDSELETQGSVTDQASQYLSVKLPISGFDPGANFINEDETVDFDLTPLHDLLIMIRPAMQILLVVMLLFTLIDFWRGVLAG